MTKWMKVTIPLLVAVLIGSVGQSQVPPGTGGKVSGDKGAASGPQKGQGKMLQDVGAKLGTVQLLMNPRVQDELNLSQEQREALHSLFEELRAAKGDQRGDGKAVEALRQIQDKVESLLSDKQKFRLRQLALQQQGPIALGRPEIAKEVGLNEAQVQEIHNLMRANAEEMRKIKESGQKPDMRVMEERRREMGEKILSLLDPAQFARWKELLGPPFDFKKK
ncbi:MAG: hypothetical protein DYH07_13045 [Armatimonadetes bacterium ATM1]|nr:MAG: hypothetical protein EDM73_13010 [Armatimonadota bacterium]MBC6970823.1 hypothetical protein [Armatimonadota bacterium]MCE7900999.1 hypothetical protein [Armatimonadetes bacterium ATM1]RIJ94574.1 MAG: hypothetical protein DCC45_12225 [Armatimonadota bacterium]